MLWLGTLGGSGHISAVSPNQSRASHCPPCSLYDWFITLLGHTGQKQQPLDQQWWLEPEMHFCLGNNFQLTGCTIKPLLAAFDK